jgi:hypothetical protein
MINLIIQSLDHQFVITIIIFFLVFSFILSNQFFSALVVYSQTTNTTTLPSAADSDTISPTIDIPSDPLIVEATDPSGAKVAYEVNATDNVDIKVTPTCIPISGSVFSLGETTITCSATDKVGNTDKESFDIRVEDTTPPETKFSGAVVSWETGSIENGESTESNDIGFEFSGTDKVGIDYFECRIDESSGKWQQHMTEFVKGISGCHYTDVIDGNHSFEVRAVDQAGNKDPTPSTFSWQIISAAVGIQDLIDFIKILDLPADLEAATAIPLDQAIAILTDRNSVNDKLACDKMASFLNDLMEISLLNLLADDDMNQLLTYNALAIIDHLGCPPPVANAGPDQIVDEGTKDITLDGTRSSDIRDESKLSFSWKQIININDNDNNKNSNIDNNNDNPLSASVIIKDANNAKAKFDAPLILGNNKNSITLPFELTVKDGDGLVSTDTVDIIVSNINTSPPIAQGQSVPTQQNKPLTINLKSTDPDSDKLTYYIVSNPSHGALMEFNKDLGIVTYTPLTDFVGSDSFTFRTNDGATDSNTATVSIEITPLPNTKPIANAGLDQEVKEGDIVTFDGSKSSDVDGTIASYLWQLKETNNENPSSIVLENANTATPAFTAPTLVSQGEEEESSSYEFELTVKDNEGSISNDSVIITVVKSTEQQEVINNEPTADSQNLETDENAPLAINLKGADVDNGDKITYSIVSEPSEGQLNNFNKDNGIVRYTPNTDFTGEDSFSFKVNDGKVDSNTANVNIIVNPINDDDNNNSEDNLLSSSSSSSSDNANDTLLQSDSISSLTPINPENTQPSISASSSSDSTTIAVTAMPDTVTTYENTAVIIPVLANDINTSNEDSKRDDNNTINIESASEPSDGTSSINKNGTITYTPNSNFIGQDSFEYTISNEDDQIDTAMVTVTVQDQRTVESSAVQEEPEEEETSEDSDD